MSDSLKTVTAVVCVALAVITCCHPPTRVATETKDTTAAQPAMSVDTVNWPVSFGFGRRATVAEVYRLDKDVRPDGQGLPPGAGTVRDGKRIYAAQCAACHGKTGVEGPNNRLVAKADSPEKAIGNYWPYATTIFDYIRRAMPFHAPGSLTDQEVYSLTAFLLHANGIIDSAAVINAETLPKVMMPAKSWFVPDDRRGGPEIR